MNFKSLLIAWAGMLLVLTGPLATGFESPRRGVAEHVVVVVWDGMRPDLISPQHTPTLDALAQRGAFFKHHHPVFVSSTEVNGTALITGDYPEHTTIEANTDYRPSIDSLSPVANEASATVERGDALTGGHYIAVPTLTEIIQRAGFPTVVAGTKDVALLLDRFSERLSPAAADSVDLHKGRALPPSAMEVLVRANDGAPFPSTITYPNAAQDRWTTRALTSGLWAKGVPKFSVLWLSDPDYSQHNSGPGSPTGLAALESCDRNLASALDELKRRGVLEQTDVFVVSDHGFSTIERGVDVAQALVKAGFNAARKLQNPKRGDVLVVGLGGSSAIYVIDHDRTVIRKLAEYFQASDFAGVIFSRSRARGTFPLSRVRMVTPTAPDLLVSLNWNGKTNAFGTPGMLTADNGKAGKGTHASLSRFDMRNTLVAAGPDLRQGFQDELPSGNADLAPTILWILGLRSPHPMDGRVLLEALSGAGAAPPKARRKTIEASAERASFKWRQSLTVSSVGKAVYFDEGNGASTPK